jgi:drug/metabolite transporter (DMT)-like permease
MKREDFYQTVLPPLGFTIALFAFWQIICKLFDVPLTILPAPSDIFAALWQYRVPIIDNSWVTLWTTLVGFALATVFGLLIGIAVGFLGVFLLVGIESITGSSDPIAILMMLGASLGYAYAVIYITRKMPGVSGVDINGIALAMTAVFYSPALVFLWPDHQISTTAIYCVIALGVFSTGIAFAVFFTVMDEIGPARASLVTYMNTAFAVVLGVLILSEPLTTGIIVGLPLVLIGSYLASRKTNA